MNNLNQEEIACAYYDVEQLNNGLITPNNVVILHQNIRSFNCNFDSFSLFLDQFKNRTHIIILTETWFSEELVGDVERYTGFHSCRSGRTGGGVSVFVANELNAHSISEHSFISDDLKICTVEVMPLSSNHKLNLIVSEIYCRPPSAPLASLSDRLDPVLIGYRDKSVILAGDFNVDLLNENQSSEISIFLYSINFSPLIRISSSITENTAKCLDQIWYNFERASFSRSIISDTTDHYPVFVVLNSLNDNKKITTTF